MPGMRDNRRSRPRIGITAGDPAGIGPEITQKAIDDPGVPCDLRADRLRSHRRGRRAGSSAAGVTAMAGRAAYDAIVRAVEDARSGAIDAIATAPINKEAFAEAGSAVAGTHRLASPT